MKRKNRITKCTTVPQTKSGITEHYFAHWTRTSLRPCSRVPLVRDFDVGCAVFSLDDIYAGAEFAVRVVTDIEVKNVPVAVFVTA